MHMTPAQALQITTDILTENGLGHWTVTFSNARTRAGSCNYAKRTISLSRFMMAIRTAEETRSTITHEVAHALTPGHGHDRVWAAQWRSMGGSGQRCFSVNEEQRAQIVAAAKWVGTCGHGKQVGTRQRQPKRMDGWSCRCPQGKSAVVWTTQR